MKERWWGWELLCFAGFVMLLALLTVWSLGQATLRAVAVWAAKFGLPCTELVALERLAATNPMLFDLLDGCCALRDECYRGEETDERVCWCMKPYEQETCRGLGIAPWRIRLVSL